MGRSSGQGLGRQWAIVAAVALACAVCAASLRAAPGTLVVPRAGGGPVAAYARLHAAGFPVSLPAWTFGTGISNAVTRTVPRAGARVAPGTAVKLGLAPPVRPVPHPVTHPAFPHFVGQRVSAANRWAAVHHVDFVAHLGVLRRGTAPWLIANYVITAQLPGSTLTVWGRQPPPPAPAKVATAPPPPPPPSPSPPPPPPPPPPVTYYQNPVYASAFPDPFVLDNGGTHSDYWAFGTGGGFPVLHSTDLVHWAAAGTALAGRPAWVVSPPTDWHPWAPSVIQLRAPCPTTGCYVMYYVGGDASLTTSQKWEVNCIGVATATQPGGPYTDQGPLTLKGSSVTTPIGCGDDTGMGNIDPSPFIDPTTGKAYLYVSTERGPPDASGQRTRQSTLSVIPLDPGLLQASGPRQALFGAAAGTWEDGGTGEGPTVEGPFMEFHNGAYYLFYSGGNWGWVYGMGYASASSPTGPFQKWPENPILTDTATVFSPGGGDRLVTGPHGGRWLVYHARANSYTDKAGRTLRIDPVTWQPDTTAGAPDVPVIAGPTSTPQTTQP